MAVYIVWEHTDGGTKHLIGIFATQEVASETIKNIKRPYDTSSFSISERLVVTRPRIEEE
jgi:hypothetical protein